MTYPLLHKIYVGLMALGLLIASYLLISRLIVLLAPIVIAFFLSLIIRPMHRTLSRHVKIPKPIGIIISMFLVIGVIGTILFFTGRFVGQQIVALSEEIGPLDTFVYEISKNLYTSLEEWLNMSFGDFDRFYNTSLESIFETIRSNTTSLGKTAINFITLIPQTAFFLLITLIATFFMSLELSKILHFLKKAVKKSALLERGLEKMRESVFFALKSYVKAQLILMSITFVLSAIGFTLLGYKYGWLMGLGLGFLDALPIFGTGSILIPMIVYYIITGRFAYALLHFILYLTLTIVRQTTEPKLLSVQIGINPLLTLSTLYLGYQLLGVMGMLLGILLLVLGITIYNALINTNKTVENSNHHSE